MPDPRPIRFTLNPRLQAVLKGVDPAWGRTASDKAQRIVENWITDFLERTGNAAHKIPPPDEDDEAE